MTHVVTHLGLLGMVGLYGMLEIATRGAVCRMLFRQIVRGLILWDLMALRLVQKIIRPRFELHGRCHQRGCCCKSILGHPPRWARGGRLGDLFVLYHRLMHNFHVVARGSEGEFIFRCGHLRADDRCGIYRYRPRICRNYPVLPFFKPPQLLPGCGYQVVPRVVAAMGSRPSLPILNAIPAVHHPTPPPRPAHASEQPQDYHAVDIT